MTSQCLLLQCWTSLKIFLEDFGPSSEYEEHFTLLFDFRSRGFTRQSRAATNALIQVYVCSLYHFNGPFSALTFWQRQPARVQIRWNFTMAIIFPKCFHIFNQICTTTCLCAFLYVMFIENTVRQIQRCNIQNNWCFFLTNFSLFACISNVIFLYFKRHFKPTTPTRIKPKQ